MTSPRPVMFDSKAFEKLVTDPGETQQNTTQTYLRVLHHLSKVDTPTELHKEYPRQLAESLWPGIIIKNRDQHVKGNYSEAIWWEVDVNGLGLIMVLEWILKSVNDGRYDDLSGMRWNVQHQISLMRTAAQTMNVEKLVSICEAALARLESGVQKDASLTIEE